MRKLILLLVCAAGLHAGSPTSVNSYVTTAEWHTANGCHGSNYPYACSQGSLVDGASLGAEHSYDWDNETGTMGWFIGYSTMTFDVRPQVPAGATVSGATLHLNVTGYQSDSGCSSYVLTGYFGSTVGTIYGTGAWSATLPVSDISLSGTITYTLATQGYDDGCHPSGSQHNSVTIDGKAAANKPYITVQYYLAPTVTGASGLSSTYSRNTEYTLSVSYNNPAGYTDNRFLSVMFNSSTSSGYSCYISYRNDGYLWFYKDDSYYYWNGIIGSGGTFSNSQCSLNMTTSSVSNVGDNTTLTFKVTFLGNSPSTVKTYANINYGGTRYGTPNLYTGWTGPYGTTATLNSPPYGVSTSGLATNFNIGTEQTISGTVRDPDGYANIQYFHILLNYGVDGYWACYTYIWPNSNYMYLLNDAADNWGGGAAFGSATTLSNSSCKINMATSSRSISGTDATATLKVTFLPGVFSRPSRPAASMNSYLWVCDFSGGAWGWSGAYQSGTARSGSRLIVNSVH